MRNSKRISRRRGTLASALTLSLLAGTLTAGFTLHSTPAANALDTAPHSPGILSYTATSPSGTAWIVPTGVTSLDVTIHSASGGATGYTGGGAGTTSSFTLPVTPGDELMLFGSTEGDRPKYRDGGKGYHNGGRGGDKSSGAAIGAGGGGSSALLRNGTLVAEVGGGGGAGGESGNRCKNCGPYGNKNRGGTGGVAGTDGTSGTGDVAGKPGIAGQHPDGNGSNGKSAATLSQGGGGGGGGGGFAGGSGGGAGRSMLGTGSGGGGGGGTSWYAPSINPTENTMRTETDSGYVKLKYRSATSTIVTAAPYVTEATPLDILVHTKNLSTTAVVPNGTLTVSGSGLAAPVTQTIRANETRVTLPGFTTGTHTLTAQFTPTDGSTPSQDDFTIDVVPATDPGTNDAPVESHTTATLATDAMHGQDTPVTVQVTPDQLGSTATGTVSVHLNGVNQGHTIALDPTGSATVILPPTLDAGIYQLTASYSGDSLIAASTSQPIELLVQRAATTATVTPSATQLAFGTPISVTLAAAPVNGQTKPNGIIAVMTETGVLRLAELSNGTATLTDVILPYGTTELYASYAGDETGNFAGSVSDPAVNVTVTQANTSTVLAVDTAEIMAGHENQFTVTVSTGSLNGTDPRGSIEIVLDGEVIDTAAVGGDIDTQENDGIARYTLTTDRVPAGTHQVIARFLPGTGFSASESLPISITVVPWHTETIASAINPSVAPADTAAPQQRLTVDVRTITPDNPTNQGATPLAWGTVQAFVGDATSHEQAVSNAVEVGDGPQTLDLRGLMPGTHQVTLVYLPDSTVTLGSETTLTVTVPANDALPAEVDDAAQHSESGALLNPNQLASTGTATATAVWILTTALTLIAAAGLVYRRKNVKANPK